MNKSNSKYKLLIELKEFCNNTPRGMIPYWRFNSLVNAFPLHFLCYSKFSKDFVSTKITAKERIKNKFNSKIKLLLDYQIEENDIIEIEKTWERIDEIIEKKRQAYLRS